jgi:membrane carboxypeptidase/penicillin-binding protein PbpC
MLSACPACRCSSVQAASLWGAVVWVGFDDGAPLGLSGARAALPIWADIMRAAASREEPGEFPVPPSMSFRWVCDSLFLEAFLPLTEPEAPCGAPTLAEGPGQEALASDR